MRILIDEDSPVQLLGALRHLLPRHQVDHVTEINWRGKKDRSVLRDAANAGYEVFITNDRNQFNDPDECAAIKRSRLHHVSYSQRRQGLTGLGLALGAVLAAMPMVMAELEQADGQRLVHIAGLSPGHRFEATDPARNPPKYWPR